MAGAYQEIVKQVLNQFGKVSNTEERDKEGFIKYSLSYGNPCHSLKMNVSVSEKSKIIRIVTCLAEGIPENRHREIYKLINDLQNEWLYMRIYMTNENDLVAEYQMMLYQPKGRESVNGFIENLQSVFRFATNITMNYAECVQNILKQGAVGSKTSLKLSQIRLNPFWEAPL